MSKTAVGNSGLKALAALPDGTVALRDANGRVLSEPAHLAQVAAAVAALNVPKAGFRRLICHVPARSLATSTSP